MKKLIFLFILNLAFISLNAQYKDRESTFSYAGLGYALVFFTNSDVNNVYPTIDLNNSSLLNEINAYYGFKVSKYFSVEFSPSILFAKSNRNIDGFYFTQNGQTYWYKPQDASLFALTLDLKARFYPFASNDRSIIKDIYLSAGGGIMYVKEEYDNYLFTDSTYTATFIASRADNNNTWVPNIVFSLGYMSNNYNFGYGLDIGYRIVPMPVDRKTALSSSNASNYNSLNLSLKALFNF